MFAPSLADARLIRGAAAERSLAAFVRLMWRAVEPQRPLVWGWVIDALCEHLEAVTKGQIRRLLINVPPGTAKSSMLCVFWPAWEWGPQNMPHLRYLTAAYSQSLTVRDNVRFGHVVTSPLYRAIWGDRFAPTENQVLFSNDRTGWKLATSVGGVGTGARSDRVLIDDPNSVKDVESRTVRDSTNQWFREVVPSRVNDLENSPIIVIQQRTHELDVSGVILEEGMAYEHLCIPMWYDGRDCVTSIGWREPRTIEGEVCWPERFPEVALEELKKSLGPFGIAGQLQQIPVPRGGSIILDEWWQTYGDPDNPTAKPFPKFEFLLGILDTAHTEREVNDPSALVILGLFQDPKTHYPQVMLVNAWRARLALNALVLRVAATCQRRANPQTGKPRGYPVDTLLIENKAAGIPVAQELRRLYGRTDFSIIMIDPSHKGDKVARAHSIVPLMSEGGVWCPNTEWAQMVRAECATFPRGAHDDLVDCFVHGMRYLRESGMMQRTAEAKLAEQEAWQTPLKARPLYPGATA